MHFSRTLVGLILATSLGVQALPVSVPKGGSDGLSTVPVEREEHIPIDLKRRAVTPPKKTTKTTPKAATPTASKPTPTKSTTSKPTSTTSTALPPIASYAAALDIKPNTSFFFSGGLNERYYDNAVAWIKAYAPKYKTMEMMIKNEKFFAPYRNKPRDPFWGRASNAMAQQSAGKVYVIMNPSMTADPKTWYKGSFWYKDEYPHLLKNTKVTQIILVHPGSKVEHIVFSRAPKANLKRA